MDPRAIPSQHGAVLRAGEDHPRELVLPQPGEGPVGLEDAHSRDCEHAPKVRRRAHHRPSAPGGLAGGAQAPTPVLQAARPEAAHALPPAQEDEPASRSGTPTHGAGAVLGHGFRARSAGQRAHVPSPHGDRSIRARSRRTSVRRHYRRIALSWEPEAKLHGAHGASADITNGAEIDIVVQDTETFRNPSFLNCRKPIAPHFVREIKSTLPGVGFPKSRNSSVIFFKCQCC